MGSRGHKMKSILTDEKDKRFLKLVGELDYEYYLRIGDELEKYREYNEFKTPHIVILMMDDDEVIACASYRASDEKSVEFKRVYVKKQYRKRGIASCIIKELEKDAIEKGFKDSHIVTGKNNHAAIGLYKKLGYYKTDNPKQFVEDKIVICMKKEF